MERARRTLGPKLNPFWNVRISQELERSALVTSPRDKTQEFRRECWDPGARAKSQSEKIKINPAKLEELDKLDVFTGKNLDSRLRGNDDGVPKT